MLEGDPAVAGSRFCISEARRNAPANHLLIVDGDAQSRHLLLRALCSASGSSADTTCQPRSQNLPNYRIDSAPDAQDTLELIRGSLHNRDPYQAIFIDARVLLTPQGAQMLDTCWQLDPKVHLVVCGPSSDANSADIAANLGSNKLLILRKRLDPLEIRLLAAVLCEKWRLNCAADVQGAALESAVNERTSQLENARKQDRLRLDLLEAVVEQRTTDLRHAAMHDALTGLPNRSMLSDRLSQVLRRYHVDPLTRFAVLFLDLDDFKLVNDSLGHGAGDALLVQVAQRITQSLRGSDGDRDGATMAARLGGDEFVVLLAGLHKFSDAEAVANRLLNILRVPYQLDGRSVRCGVSIGLTTSAVNYQTVEQILRDADIAMYAAKAGNKDRYVVFTPTMHRDVVARVSLENELRHALENGEFELHYQPIVSLTTGQLAGFEALARWNHPTRGAVQPDDFIPMAESTGIIHPLGLWAIEQAAAQSKRWEKQFPNSPITIGVNLSTRQMDDEALAYEIKRRISASGCDPSRLILEVTEGSLGRERRGAETFLQALRTMNLRTYIDDFGTGYSSLGRLPHMPIDGIKIDRLFIGESSNLRKYAAIISAILNLARHMDASVVAEGVESLEQVALLQALDCEKAQGFYFSPAVSARDAERFFHEKWQVACPISPGAQAA